MRRVRGRLVRIVLHGDAKALVGPVAQIVQLAALAAKRPPGVVRRIAAGAAAGGAAHGGSRGGRAAVHWTTLHAARCGIRAWERPGAQIAPTLRAARCGIRAWGRPGAQIAPTLRAARCGIRAWERPGAQIAPTLRAARCALRDSRLGAARRAHAHSANSKGASMRSDCNLPSGCRRIRRTDTASRLPLISGTRPSDSSSRRRSSCTVRPCGRPIWY